MTRVEHNGYVLVQTDNDGFMAYKDGKFFLHASTTGFMEEEEQIEAFDQLLKVVNNSKDAKRYSVKELFGDIDLTQFN